MQETQVLFLGQVDPLEKEMQPTPVVLPGNPMDIGVWKTAVHGAAKSQTRLSD